MANIYCPLCGNENKCQARTVEYGQCWCNRVEFPRGIFELVPAESKNKHCICEKCVEAYKKNNV
ncbi:cysteine-rich CWC family protein [Salsuginibacillus kocurii]|uniref:cysteine-rich CWC family protein n=1 Tax=Salsuginibacillus kocurii TaxID=427078 RepID=UPI000362F4DB|nr:cysteine-rich CWC family protein [Salsuginibacillus kocurii]